jgi:hypothetical protein
MFLIKAGNRRLAKPTKRLSKASVTKNLWRISSLKPRALCGHKYEHLALAYTRSSGDRRETAWLFSWLSPLLHSPAIGTLADRREPGGNGLACEQASALFHNI